MTLTIIGNDVTPHVRLNFTNLSTGRPFKKICHDMEQLTFQVKCFSNRKRYSLDKVIKVNRPTFAEGLDYEKIEEWRRELCTQEKWHCN